MTALQTEALTAEELVKIARKQIDAFNSGDWEQLRGLLASDASYHEFGTERAIEGPPTLAVEVVSPFSEQTDRRRKLDLYARHGVAYYWVVDPVGRTIDAYVLESGAYRLAARLAGEQPAALPPFDGLLLDPADIWA